jgi:hypothetical protein
VENIVTGEVVQLSLSPPLRGKDKESAAGQHNSQRSLLAVRRTDGQDLLFAAGAN